MRSDGRWHGRLTSRPLPEHDETLEALSPVARAELAEHWLTRGASERRVGEAFAVIAETMRAVAASDEVIALAERAVDDELRHAEISRVVASRFAGRELPEPALLPLSLPLHRGASPALKHTLYIVGHCALNETFASSVLEASLAVTSGPLAKAALRELLADEIDHARLGWAHLASLDEPVRAALAPWLPGLVEANLRMWRTTPREYPSDPSLVSQGALTRELLETALQAALTGIILPGFAHVGLASDALTRFVAPPSADA